MTPLHVVKASGLLRDAKVAYAGKERPHPSDPFCHSFAARPIHWSGRLGISVVICKV